MADLHGQSLVTSLTTVQRIAAGEAGQTGAVNIFPEDLRVQFTAPTVGVTFGGSDIDLGNLRGTYYSAFNQSGNISFNFVNAINGGNAFIRITSNGTGTFTFTAAESFGIATGDTLPAGNYIFRFLQTPYGVSVVVLRETGGNPRGAGEGLVLTGNDLGLGGSLTQFASINTDTFGFAFTSAGQTVTFGQNALSIGDIANAIIQADQGLTINSNAGGNLSLQSDAIGTLNSVGNLILSTALNNVGNSSNINISTGNSTGTTTDSGSINITTGTATGTRGSVVIQGLTFPLTDGTVGQFIGTNGSNVLSFSDPREVGTPAARIETLTSTSNSVTIDFESLSRNREFSLSLNEDTTISFANASSRSTYKIFLTITNASRTITLPTGSLMPVSTSNSSDITWTTATRQLELSLGQYELAADYNGTNDFWKITDRYE